MMENKSLILAIALILAVGGGVWYFTAQNTSQESGIAGSTSSPTSPTPAATPSHTPKAPSPISGGSTYHSLLTQKGSYQCDYNQSTASGQNVNVIYLSDGKLRAEFHPSYGGVVPGNLAVYDGHYLYTWTEGSSSGVRTVITSLGQLPSAIPQDLTSGKIYGGSYDTVGWKCHPWITDRALLTPPSYVSFR